MDSAKDAKGSVTIPLTDQLCIYVSLIRTDREVVNVPVVDGRKFINVLDSTLDPLSPVFENQAAKLVRVIFAELRKQRNADRMAAKEYEVHVNSFAKQYVEKLMNGDGPAPEPEPMN